MIYMMMIVMMNFGSIICEHDDVCAEMPYDPYKFDKPDPIWFEGHLWQPVMIEHCEDCPCGRDDKYRD